MALCKVCRQWILRVPVDCQFFPAALPHDFGSAVVCKPPPPMFGDCGNIQLHLRFKRQETRCCCDNLPVIQHGSSRTPFRKVLKTRIVHPVVKGMRLKNLWRERAYAVSVRQWPQVLCGFCTERIHHLSPEYMLNRQRFDKAFPFQAHAHQPVSIKQFWMFFQVL